MPEMFSTFWGKIQLQTDRGGDSSPIISCEWIQIDDHLHQTGRVGPLFGGSEIKMGFMGGGSV